MQSEIIQRKYRIKMSIVMTSQRYETYLSVLEQHHFRCWHCGLLNGEMNTISRRKVKIHVYHKDNDLFNVNFHNLLALCEPCAKIADGGGVQIQLL